MPDPAPGVRLDQCASLALGLAMHNAVAQQQQLYMLQNAVTAAFARAILDGGPESAQKWTDAMKLVQDALAASDPMKGFEKVKDLITALCAGS